MFLCGNGACTFSEGPGCSFFQIMLIGELFTSDSRLPARLFICSGILTNSIMCYFAFGDVKFVPGISEHQLDVIVYDCPLKIRGRAVYRLRICEKAKAVLGRGLRSHQKLPYAKRQFIRSLQIDVFRLYVSINMPSRGDGSGILCLLE
ncbi:hypothetical protein R1flu_028116 [Riccia fluitans]|uniref:Uncharacterized protein n=1 Tax=Riccia fluitans TaxID=41844 RepID=A0ABD1XLF2_9MARC